MMQNTIVNNFRARLRTHGYTAISIKRLKDDNGSLIPDMYLVSAIDPVFHIRLTGSINCFGTDYLLK